MSHFFKAIGRGIVAGAAGTAAMTAVQKIEMKMTGRGPSTAPADVVEKITPVDFDDEQQKKEASSPIHYAYGRAGARPTVRCANSDWARYRPRRCSSVSCGATRSGCCRLSASLLRPMSGALRSWRRTEACTRCTG